MSNRSFFASVGNVAKDVGKGIENFFVNDVGNTFRNLFGKRKKRSAGCGIGAIVPDVVDVPGVNMDKLKEFAKSKLLHDVHDLRFK